jgi:hypothetical protein
MLKKVILLSFMILILGVFGCSQNEKNISELKLKSDELNLEISYPERLGEAKISDSNGLIDFNNLSSNIAPPVDPEWVWIQIMDYDQIIESYDTFVPGGDGAPLNLNYFDYMKNKLQSYSKDCKQTLYGENGEASVCIDLEKVKIADKEYLTYIDYRWSYDQLLTKKWIYFFDDKMFLVSVNLENIVDPDINPKVDYQIIDNIIYPDEYKNQSIDSNKIDHKKIESIKYNDFGISDKKMQELDESVNKFLASLEFKSTISDEKINQNIKKLDEYISKIDLAKNSKDALVLSYLSKSEFIQVRKNVARNENTSVQILKELANDPSDIVKVSVKHNPSTPKEIADNIINPF